MDHKQMVVANVHYRSSQGTGPTELEGILRYCEYRDDRDGHLPDWRRRLERWTDKGLGDNAREIAAHCEALKSAHVQAFTLVINPNPDLISFVPEQQRVAFVRELTEGIIEDFFEARGLDTPDYAYVVHRRATTDAQQPGRDNPHTHVFLPGTYDSWADGARLPLYMNRNKRENHIEMLHQIAQTHTDRLLQRDVGRDWEQRYETLIAQREQVASAVITTPASNTAQSDQSEIPAETPTDAEEAPQGRVRDRQGVLWDVWWATQHTDPASYQVGLVMKPVQGDSEHNAYFHPLVQGLSPEHADYLAYHLLAITDEDPDTGLTKALQSAEQIQQMDNSTRQHWFDRSISSPQPPEQSAATWSGPSLDL